MVNYLRHPLDGAFERVRRAGEHLSDFKSRVEVMLEKQADSVSIQIDPNPPHRILKVTRPSETFFDMRFGILAGETIYNLRCALDYLVFELAKLDSGVEQDGTQFPIVDTKLAFDRRVNSPWLKGINATHVATIECLQPYNGCTWMKRLQECSNPDKHRHLAQMGGTATINVHSSLETDIDRCLGYEREIPHPIAGHAPVKLKIYASGSIAFGDGALVVDTIEEIKAQVGNVLTTFKLDF